MIDFSLTDEQKDLQFKARRFPMEEIIHIVAECDRNMKFPNDVEFFDQTQYIRRH